MGASRLTATAPFLRETGTFAFLGRIQRSLILLSLRKQKNLVAHAY